MNSAVPMHSRVESLLSNLLKALEVISKQSERSQGGFSGEKARGPRRERQLHPGMRNPRILMRIWVVCLPGILPFVGLPALLPSHIVLVNSHSVMPAPGERNGAWFNPDQF